jgi:hypothetical protein
VQRRAELGISAVSSLSHAPERQSLFETPKPSDFRSVPAACRERYPHWDLRRLAQTGVPPRIQRLSQGRQTSLRRPYLTNLRLDREHRLPLTRGRITQRVPYPQLSIIGTYKGD